MSDANKKSTITFSKAEIDAGCPDFAQILKDTTPNESLFEQIANCFSDSLKGFAKYVCKDETKGQDAFQDAMVAAMTYIDTYRGDSPIEPWLRRIVVSACSRQRRGKKNDPSINRSLDAMEGDNASLGQGPEQEIVLMLKERLDLLSDEMSDLDEPDRSLLELHDLKEVPIADLCVQFDLTQEAVKSRLKRARARVREKLIDSL